MSFWEKLLSWVRGVEGDSSSESKDNTTRHVGGCPFCGGPTLKLDREPLHLYPVWNCACGALGSGAWLPDLDEVGDQLLVMLGINVRVSEPCVPTDHSDISIQRYDVNKVERNMADVLKQHRYEFRIAPGNNQNERMYWARKSTENWEGNGSQASDDR